VKDEISFIVFASFERQQYRGNCGETAFENLTIRRGQAVVF
jgi:hypothetical protein